MDNTFSLKRFSLLVRYQWADNRKSYILIWAALALILLVLAFVAEGVTYTYGYFIIVFVLVGSVISTTGLSHWNNFSRSSQLLLLPATVIEKFLCILFYGLILYIPVFLVTFVLIRYVLLDLILLTISTNGLSPSALTSVVVKEISSHNFQFYAILAMMSLLFVQSICMISALGFKKWQFLYAVLIIAGIWLIYSFGTSWLMASLTHIKGGTINAPGILPYFHTEFGYTVSSGSQATLPANWELLYLTKVIRNINNLVWLIIFGMLYTAAWYKFKEREI
jgi:hypothetical protein